MDLISKKIIILILTLVFSLGQLGRLVQINEIVFHLNDFLIGVIVFVWLVIKLRQKKRIYFDNIAKSALVFIFICILSLLLNIPNFQSKELLIGSLYLVRWALYFFLYIIFINEKIPLKLITNYVIVALVLISLLGLGQYFFFPDLTSFAVAGWDPHLFRLTAPFFDPTFTGAVMVIFLIFLINIYWTQNKSFIFWFGFILAYLSISFTYSRAVYLFYIVSMFVICIVKKSPKIFIIVLFLGILTLWFLPKQKSYGTKLERSETLAGRVVNWQQSFSIFINQPFFGSGFNTYRYSQKKYGFLKGDDFEKSHAGAGADSSILFILATTGIAGFLAYLNLLRDIFKKSLFNVKSPSNLLLFATLIGLMAHSIFTNSLFYPWILELIWLEAALVTNKN